MGKSPCLSLSMDILLSPPPSEPKICYTKNCIVECDSRTLLLPSLVFFSVSQVNHGKWLSMLQSLVKPTTRYLWARLFPYCAGSGQVGPWLVRLVCWPAPGLPGSQLRHPLWYTPCSPGMLAGPHTVALVSETHWCAPLRLKYVCLGRTKVLQRKLCWNLHPQAHEVPSMWNILHRLDIHPCKCLPI